MRNELVVDDVTVSRFHCEIVIDEVGIRVRDLRALEAREVRRVGANSYKPVDVRVIAATNRDLRADVNAGRFRADLYFRLAVVTIAMPPLRQRPEDIPAIAEEIIASLRAPLDATDQLRTPEFMAQIRNAAWPGNVRELRNYIERCLILQTIEPREEEQTSTDTTNDGGFVVDPNAPYASERERAIADFEGRYFHALLRLHDGKVARAAGAAGMDRAYLYRLLRRHGIDT